MAMMKKMKVGCVRTVLALTLGFSISSLANASKMAPSKDAGQLILMTADISSQERMMQDVIQSEKMLASLLSEGSAVVSAKFLGVESSTVASISP